VSVLYLAASALEELERCKGICSPILADGVRPAASWSPAGVEML
jgi:hypothetical protein